VDDIHRRHPSRALPMRDTKEAIAIPIVSNTAIDDQTRDLARGER